MRKGAARMEEAILIVSDIDGRKMIKLFTIKVKLLNQINMIIK